MTLADIQTQITFLTNKSTTAYTNANRLISINNWYHKVAHWILQSQDLWQFDDDNNTDFGILTTSMVASQRDYSMPLTDNVLRIRRVDFTYDGTNYYRAVPWDETETGGGVGNDTTLDGNFAKTKPAYTIKGNSINIYPLCNAADVTAGATIRMEVDRDIVEFTSAELTAGTKSPGFQKGFHEILSWGAAYDWFEANGPTDSRDNARLKLLELEQRIKGLVSSRVEDGGTILKAAYIDYE